MTRRKRLAGPSGAGPCRKARQGRGAKQEYSRSLRTEKVYVHQLAPLLPMEPTPFSGFSGYGQYVARRKSQRQRSTGNKHRIQKGRQERIYLAVPLKQFVEHRCPGLPVASKENGVHMIPFLHDVMSLVQACEMPYWNPRWHNRQPLFGRTLQSCMQSAGAAGSSFSSSGGCTRATPGGHHGRSVATVTGSSPARSARRMSRRCPTCGHVRVNCARRGSRQRRRLG